MPQVKKYDYQLEQVDDLWTARITRKITSSKVVVSKQQDSFENEAAAKAWAEQEIVNFSKTQKQNNQRQGSARKENEQTRVQRSARRAEKTANAKASEASDRVADPSQDDEE